jgi:HK97 family phage portal protein
MSLDAEYQRYNMPDTSRYETQADLYKKLTWIQIAVTFFANAASACSLDIKKVSGEELIDVPNHDFELLLRKPNPLQSRAEFLGAHFAYWKLTGNSYWFLNRISPNSPPVEIWLIPPMQIQPVPDGRSYIAGYEYDAGTGMKIMIPPENIVHFKMFNPQNPFVGLSPLESAALISAGDIEMQRWNTNLFAKDNAKIPGALAFADPIPDSDWNKLKADIKNNWGGANRSGPMLMRNTGAGGVQWLAMSLSQRDMEFLAGRKFTKEEIFTLFAPGLAAMIDVNATEANSKTGMTVFNSYTLWPGLCTCAEKITNDLLPVYGDEFIAEFEDPRITDRVLELQEQQEYSRTHTVNEIRKEKYGDKPLEDERGELFPSQIGPTTGIQEEEEELPDENNVTDNVPDDESLEENEDNEDNEDNQEEEERAKWQRKAIKALKDGKNPDVKFESTIIAPGQQALIHAGLKVCKNADEIKDVFQNNIKSDAIYDQIAQLFENIAMMDLNDGNL